MLFNRAKRWQWIDRNPAMGVETYPEPPREEYLSLTEVELIFQHLPDNVYGDIIRVLMQTGARPCEVYEMRWADLDLAELRWTKPASGTKQKKTHHTVLSAPVAEIIARQPKASPFVFINPQGKQINKVDSTWKRTLEQAGVKHHRLYAVRHTVASMLASAGVDLYTIGKHLGHSHPSTTARYAHMHEEALRRTADIVAFPTKKAG
jgi:integrase